MTENEKCASVAVIGAGPAGMAAALEASRRGGEVILLDGNAITGRKLRVTGGGRGNLTNLHATPEKYFTHGSTAMIQAVFQQMDPRDLIRYFHELGILTWHTDDGWVYPVSNSAVNVSTILEARLREADVQIRLGTLVQDIIPEADAIRLVTNSGEEIRCLSLIVACGGKAYPDLGSTGSLYKILQRLGHTMIPVTPALAPIETDPKAVQKLQGIRLDAGVTLLSKDAVIAETTGNIIFTQWGINGPGVMDLSHHVQEYPGEVLSLRLNFLGNYHQEFLKYITDQRNSQMSIEAMLGIVLPPKLCAVLLEKAHLRGATPISQIDDRLLQFLILLAQEYRIDVKGVRGYDQCQVTGGGITLDEVDPFILQSRLQPRIWLAGEVLDVIGPCGGYNLHWAFSTGILAGRAVSIAN